MKRIKHISFCLLFLIGIGINGFALICSSCTPKKQANIVPLDTDTIVVKVEPPKTLTFYIGGDLMQHGPQIQSAKQSDGTYDYAPCFEYVTPKISSADIAIANLEVTLAGPPYSGYPHFSAPDEYAKAIKDAGFDILTTCNNHSVDTGSKGLERTIDKLDELGIPHFGTYKTQEERDSLYPFVYEKNGIKMAMLTYTYATNGIPVREPNVVNRIDTAQIAIDIEKAKALNPDVIIAFMHWGIEYKQLPAKNDKDLADWMFEKGVDHIIGGHPHVIQPMEIREDSLGNKHLMVFSLGNYVSNQSKTNTDGGACVTFELTKTEDSTSLTDCSYSFNWVSRPATNEKGVYIIYPEDSPDSLLNTNEKRLKNIFLTNSRALYKKHNKGIEERAL